MHGLWRPGGIHREARSSSVPVYCLARPRGSTTPHSTTSVYETSQVHDPARLGTYRRSLQVCILFIYYSILLEKERKRKCLDATTYAPLKQNNKKLSYRRETARQLPTWRGG